VCCARHCVYVERCDCEDRSQDGELLCCFHANSFAEPLPLCIA
jgi:hypothetical protein